MMTAVKERIKALQYGNGRRVYVAEFSGSLVKIGRTANLRSRLSQLHSYGLCRMGGSQLLRWVDFGPFEGRGGHEVEEVTLIRCTEVFNRVVGTREWFSPADFKLAVRMCRQTVNERHRRLQ